MELEEARRQANAAQSETFTSLLSSPEPKAPASLRTHGQREGEGKGQEWTGTESKWRKVPQPHPSIRSFPEEVFLRNALGEAPNKEAFTRGNWAKIEDTHMSTAALGA